MKKRTPLERSLRHKGLTRLDVTAIGWLLNGLNMTTDNDLNLRSKDSVGKRYFIESPAVMRGTYEVVLKIPKDADISPGDSASIGQYVSISGVPCKKISDDVLKNESKRSIADALRGDFKPNATANRHERRKHAAGRRRKKR